MDARGLKGALADMTADPLHPEHLAILRDLAVAAAYAAGEVARTHFAADNLVVNLKNDRSEVSAADEAAQAAIVATIREARPNDAFITEETLVLDRPAPAPTNDRFTWIIDPIDGTRNYIRRIPMYSTSIACMYGGLPVVGVIYVPELDKLFTATPDRTCLDGEAVIRLDGPMARQRGITTRPVVGMPSRPVGRVNALAHAWLDHFVCRCFGSTAWHLALIASGELVGALSDNPKLWDIAAGWLIVSAAGGEIADLDGRPIFPLDVATYDRRELPFIAGRPDVMARLRQPT